MRGIALAWMLTVAVVISGCPAANSPERIGYETIVASKAFIDKSYAQHPECVAVAGVNGTSATQTVSTATVCVDLGKARAAKDTLIDVMETLCAGPNFNQGLSCDFPKKGTPGYQQAVDKVNAAIASYNATATDLKGVL